jgi:hypothetical protein
MKYDSLLAPMWQSDNESSPASMEHCEDVFLFPVSR